MHKALLVGGGAREHAIAKRLCESSELISAMKHKNPGIMRLAKKVLFESDTNAEKIAEFAAAEKPDFAFVGPDAALGAGVADAIEAKGIPCVGASQKAAMLETNKLFCRQFLKDNGINCNPDFFAFDDAQEAVGFLKGMEKAVVKPLGLTGGKGVKVMGTQVPKQEALDYAAMLVKKDGMVLVEECLEGEEFSLQAFVSGESVVEMPLVQDHKRAFENDKGPNCYSEDTEILTESGWKTFDKIGKETKVAIYQPRFRRIRFEKPKEVYWKKYTGEMVSLKHREIDLLVTPNHRMLIKPRRSVGKFRVIEAKDLKGEFFIPQTGVWIGTTKKNIIIPKLRNKYGPRKKSIKIPFETWAEVLGLFLSEGYTARDRVYICQSKTSKHYNDMKKVLEKLPFKVTYRKDRFRINSVQLASFLKCFGRAREKFIPDYIKNAKRNIIEIFLQTFLKGDGNIHRGQMRFCSSSKKMIDDIQELLLKTGRVGIITRDKRTTMLSPINHKTYVARPMYAIEVKKRNKTSIRKNHIRTVEYNGFIGCVTVSTGFVIIRRNNRVAICGNTGGMGS